MIIGNESNALINIDDINLDCDEQKILNDIIELYKKNYPLYSTWTYKKNYIYRENLVRFEYTDSQTSIGNNYLGKIINNDNNLCLDDNFIKFMLLRYKGLQKCIKEKTEKKEYLEYLYHELEKLEILYSEYKIYSKNILSNIEIKIEFVKKICEAIQWSDSTDNSTCDIVFQKIDLHPKTFGIFKQLVLGSNDTDYLLFKTCSRYFMGFVEASIKEACDKTVEWNILLNKYSVLSAYYIKAPFIRLLLKERLIMPYRRFQSIPESEKKGKKVGTFNFSPFIFNIHYDETITHSLNITGRYNYNKFLFYDENNFPIYPPLLSSATTITYTEFRDLLCYLNLPVFRSTVNPNMLFFPNYDLHQRLLEIQGLDRNHNTYTGESMDWKWFKQGETAAKEAIKCFCQEYEESPDYGIVPIEYVWYDIVYPDSGNIKKFIFLVVPFEELDYYTGSDIYKRDGKYYVCNKDEVPEHMVPELKLQKGLEHIDYIWYEEYLFLVIPVAEAIKYGEKITAFTNRNKKIYYCTKPYTQDRVPWGGLTKVKQKSFRDKYLKYKIKYLNLKKLLQKI